MEAFVAGVLFGSAITLCLGAIVLFLLGSRLERRRTGDLDQRGKEATRLQAPAPPPELPKAVVETQPAPQVVSVAQGTRVHRMADGRHES